MKCSVKSLDFTSFLPASCLEALWEAAMLQVLPAFWVEQEDQELDRSVFCYISVA